MIFVVVVVLAFECINCSTISCTPTINGKKYDFTSIVSPTGKYQWQADWNGTLYTWQLQVCGDITNQTFKSCTHDSPINQITPDGNQCTYVGETLVSAWDVTPYDDGVMITYFHGQPMNNINWRSATLYFVCGVDQFDYPIFEHIRTCYDSESGSELGGIYHFAIVTRLAC